MASAEITDLEITDEDVQQIINEYKPQLVKCLPMKDTIFSAMLQQQKLFSGNLQQDVMNSATDAAAAGLLLQRAVERPLSIGDREPFDKLLLVMEKCDDSTLNKLAKKIKHKLSDIHQRDSPVKHIATEVGAYPNPMITPEHRSMRTPVQEPTKQFKGTKPMKTDESPIQKLTNQFEGAKVFKPMKESPSFAEALQSHHYHIKWTSCSDLPCKLYIASVAVSSAGDNVYVTAGDAPDENTYNNVYCYNTNNDNWTALPQPGHRFGILHMVDDRLTIFGGEDPVIYGVLNKVTTYNNDTKSWYSEYPDMLNKRFMPGVITYNNYVIVMGGISSSGNNHDNIEVMDYHHEPQWKNVFANLRVPMRTIKPTLSGDNISIVGYNDDAGDRSNEYHQISIQEILDLPLSTSATSNQKKLALAPYYNTATVPYSNPPVIIGGDVRGVPIGDITLYDSSKNSWMKVDSLTSARAYVGVALLNNNSIIVIGGIGGGTDFAGVRPCLTTVEIGNIVLNQ